MPARVSKLKASLGALNMKPISADQIIEGLSEDLQDLIVREAFIRKRKLELAAVLAERRTQEAAVKDKKPGLFGGKSAKEEHEALVAKIRGEIAGCEQAIANCDIILKKTARIIETELENFFQAKSDDFRKLLAAQKMIPEWEQAVVLYQACLKRFIMKLGIARNQMSSGYDRKAGTFSAGAQEAFASALSAAKTLEAEAAIPNQIAKRQREALGVDPVAANDSALPYVGDSGVVKQVAAFKTYTLEVAQTKISAMIDESEKIHGEGIPGLLEGIARERAGQEAEQRKHIDRARDEIRLMADGLVDPAQMEAVCASMEARFVTLTG